MMVLTIRTDRPEAEVGLYKDGNKVEYKSWQADRQLTETIHRQIKALLDRAKLGWQDLEGVIVFEGPGSFTGLRIGITVANSLAFANEIPVVGANGNQWIKQGLKQLSAPDNTKIALPKYGAEPNITKPKK